MRSRRCAWRVPAPVPIGTFRADGYWRRFREIMGLPPEPVEPSADGEDEEAEVSVHGMTLTEEGVAAGFRSQRTWDATMGESVVRALAAGAPKVILLVGQFHSDFDGGTVLEIRGRAPFAHVLTVSTQRADGTSFRAEDDGRADIVVYTTPRE